MDEKDLDNGNFTSETVSLLILNELRLMRRDMKSGLIRVEEKIDDVLLNIDDLDCFESVDDDVASKKAIDNDSSTLAAPNYINKARADSRVKPAAAAETKDDADRREEPNSEPLEIISCTVHVDMDELPDDDDFLYSFDDEQAVDYMDDLQRQDVIVENDPNDELAMVVENEQGRYQCTLCPSSYTIKGNLRRHYRQHTGDMRYQCSICDRRFYRNNYLIRHMKKHNELEKEEQGNERPFKCASCGRRYADPDHLRDHMRLHRLGSDRVYPCPCCSEKFTRQDLYKKHMRKVHPEESH